MGEYNRVYKIIDELKAQKKAIIKQIECLRDKLEEICNDLEEDRLYEEIHAKIDNLYDDLWDVNIEIGECEGYIRELQYIDGEASN